MRKLSLFSGIGGLDRAAHMAGIETVAFCEIEKYPVEVLKRRFPGREIINDVRELDGNEFRGIDIISGGFPCQPFSVAGKREGEFDERHLFPEMARIIAEARPEWIVAENVQGLFSICDERGVKGGVLGDCLSRLSEMGYAVGWCCYGAVDVGAPHQRNRVFLVGNRDPEKVKKVMSKVLNSLFTWQGDCWPTPVAADGGAGAVISEDDRFVVWKSGNIRKINRHGTDGSLGLARTVTVMNELWNTPMAGEHKNYTLMPSRMNRNDLAGDLLRLKELWSTPVSSQRGGTRIDFAKPLNTQAAEESGRSDLVKYTEKRIACKAKLNPDWVALLMGFPVGWASLGECEETFRGFPAGKGPYQYDFEPPRLIDRCENLAKQLKGYGNAVVPYQALPIFKTIKEVSG